MSVTVAAFYRFAPVADPAAAQHAIARTACRAGVRGSVILAEEGVNGTLAGSPDGLAAALGEIRALPGFGDLAPRMARAETQPFRRLKVRVKPEIVTFGRPASPARATGTRVAPEDWNAVIADPRTVVVDTRNAYEVAIGRFRGARDPGTAGFRDFPAWWEREAPSLAGRRVAMYCTGGIRCEKASAWLLGQGAGEVLQLDGGIFGYLERVAPERSLWEGACFVFDQRVAVGHGLVEAGHTLCRACGRAVAPQDRGHPDHVPGVSCPACIAEYTDADRARFAERERQVALAEARGGTHLGRD